jgi:nucleoside 2-deoxyribosyltransferase
MPGENQLTCLILGPVGDEGAEKIRKVLREVLEQQGVRNVNIDDQIIPGASIAETILLEIQTADFVIADLTGSNPNVLYALGFAYALDKRVMPIVSREQDHVPVYLRGILYFVYDPDLNTYELKNVLSSWIARFIGSIAVR